MTTVDVVTPVDLVFAAIGAIMAVCVVVGLACCAVIFVRGWWLFSVDAPVEPDEHEQGGIGS